MFSALSLFAQIANQPDPDLSPIVNAIALVFTVFALAIGLLMIVSYWKIFTKAGKPGWASIVPIYNVLVFLQIVNRPGWWLILFCIPIVGFVFALIAIYDLSKAFGHDVGFFFGIILLPFIFLPILAFGKSRYVGVTH